MSYQLAQLNIAHFRLPAAHSANADFMNSLDRVNAAAESQAGFIWRFIETGDKPERLHPFTDQRTIVNLSVWSDIPTLFNFVYKHEEHQAIMRRRKEWFDKLDFHMVLWWIKSGEVPSVREAAERLQRLQKKGPTAEAFTFKQSFPPTELG